MEKIGSKYPVALENQLLDREEVRYFSYISQNGGCLSRGSREEHWIALTNRRALYKALVRDADAGQSVEKDGIIPLEKISFIEVTEASEDGCGGCRNKKAFMLKIGSSGSEVMIPIPTEDKGYHVRQTYSEINQERGGSGGP